MISINDVTGENRNERSSDELRIPDQLIVVSKHCNSRKVFIQYSNDMQEIYEKKYGYEYNQNKKHKILILFDDVIADMLKKRSSNSKKIIHQRKKTKHFFCFYYKTLFYYAK